jgi:hypothetical protein
MTTPDETKSELLDRLVELSRQIEEHAAALFLLETERAELGLLLRGQQRKESEAP